MPSALDTRRSPLPVMLPDGATRSGVWCDVALACQLVAYVRMSFCRRN
jgi:hypothetical protein